MFIDAWQDDFAEDPFTAVMAEIDSFVSPLIKKNRTTGEKLKSHYDALKSNFTTIVVKSAKGAVSKLAKKAIGDATEDISEIFTSHGANADATKEAIEGAAEPLEELSVELLDKHAEKLLTDFKTSKESLGSFRQNLEKLLQAIKTETSDYKLPFYIMVDELDRCRPTYAIAMLERIKHLFDVPDVVFILSTDTGQLAESVKAVYGSGFNGVGYLQRFFSQTYELPRAERSQLIEHFFLNSGIDVQKLNVPDSSIETLTKFVASTDVFFKLEVRELLSCLDILHTITTSWQFKFPILVPLMLPLIVAFKRGWEIDNFEKQSHWFGLPKNDRGEYLEWKIDLGGRREFDMMAFAQTVKGASSAVRLREYIDRVSQPNYVEDYAAAYAYEFLLGELNQSGNRGRTYLLSYPDLIRRAGQLRQMQHQ